MEIISNEKVDLAVYNKVAKGDIYKVHVRIYNVEERAIEIIKTTSDRSWINNLNIVAKRSYTARAERTINKLVKDIFEKVDNTVSAEFGEYLVSVTARDSLVNEFKHKVIPLAELWKEKITGNPGFDFHTESETKLISYGEGKYSSSINPHTVAINQIVGFISEEKDIMELVDLEHFSSADAIENALNGEKAFVAAFSINGNQYKRIFDTAIESKDFDQLLEYPELYLIGIEVCI